MEKLILNIWYSNKTYYRLVSYLLIPISFVYILFFYLINFFKYKNKIDIPVICVGNINVGGTGKTSALLKIINHLKNNKKNICVLLKGYGGKKTFFKKVLPSDSAIVVGDEAILYSNHAATFISTNRKIAVNKIANDNCPDVILLDDGFQDRSLYKDKNILMVNGERGFGNGLCLPAGPLRELIKPALKRAQFLIIVGDDETNIKNTYKNSEIEILKASVKPLNINKNKNYLAFCGIGYNQSFFDILTNNNCSVQKTIEFPDHHLFSADELNQLKKIATDNNLALITTEKDFVRIPKEKRIDIEYLKIEMELPNIDEFMKKLTN
tara:strand:- start:927 stop:1898 length:972 start_codon:yes stop_codon:yes gene_type:complete